MEEFILKRIEENNQIFNEEELLIIKQNINAAVKIYLLACLDSPNISYNTYIKNK